MQQRIGRLTWVAMICTAMMAIQGLAEVAGDVLHNRLRESIRIFNEKALSMDESLMAASAVEAMLKTVDAKGGVYSNDELQAMLDAMRGLHFAVGVKLSFTGQVVSVAQVLPGSPAEAAGIEVDDRLIRVNEQSLEGLTPPEIISLLRCDEAVNVALQFERGEEKIDVTVQPAPVQLPTVELVEYFPEGIVYVMVNGIFEGGGEALLSLLRQCREDDCFGVILDLRGANGMHIASVNRVIEALAPEATVLYRYEDRTGTTVLEFESGQEGALGLPLMMLVDESTGGASELLAVVGKHALKGCMVLGGQTSGTPLLREVIPLADNVNMYMATRRLLTGSKPVVYDGVSGLIPDIKVASEWNDMMYEPELSVTTLEEEKEDKALRERLRGDGPLSRATDLLLGLKALNIHSVKAKSE
jgi:carboxyl-terminal processing protease